MKKDKIFEYLLSILLCIFLFFNIFIKNVLNNKIIMSIFLIGYLIICIKLIKTKKINNINKKTVIFLNFIFAIFFLGIIYIIGIFTEFYKNPIKLNFNQLFIRILPHTIILIVMEKIREIFIFREDKKVLIFITIALILTDIVVNINMYSYSNLEDILQLIGCLVISSISINMYCGYIAKTYGCIPNILYRTITTIYVYIIPILPDMYSFFEATIKIIYPYIMFLIMENLFPIDNFKMAIQIRKNNNIFNAIILIFVVSLVLLISCKFKYGMIAVGSNSMYNTISKGDAVIFEAYNKQELIEGQVIIFMKDGIMTVHRIQKIKLIEKEKVYYTKGDNNQQLDDGYRKENDIIGIVKFKVLYIGWPTLMLNEMFQ